MQKDDAEEEAPVVSGAQVCDARPLVIHPRLGTGWETAVDESRREVRLRFKLLGLPLPVGKRVPFLQVTHIAAVCRMSWWSRAGGPFGNMQNLVAFGLSSVNEQRRDPMPTKGWRYDLLMTRKGGHTTRLKVLKSSRDADDLAGQLRLRTGLPSVD